MSDKEDLSAFRQQWRKELVAEVEQSTDDNPNIVESLAKCVDKLGITDEDEARTYFAEAVENERAGQVFEALRLYQKAVRLVPDIERKMYEWAKQEERDFTRNCEIAARPNDDSSAHNLDLYQQILESMPHPGRICENTMAGPRVLVTQTHISDLPLEIFLIISRWIVSQDLDVRSLENCSQVCKGFFICARDPELWRMICLKVWGTNLGALRSSPYSSWRNMYLNRSRVHFDGCYISKTSYYRYGENSFQDQFYKPVHHVEYHRYMRFFPDGVVLMWTTPNEPQVCLRKLSERNPRQKEIFRGFYRLTGDDVSVILKKNNTADNKRLQQSFHVELRISSNASRKKFNQLQWKRFSMLQTRNQSSTTTTDFELTKRQFPPFLFSRVEHYTAQSDSMLAL